MRTEVGEFVFETFYPMEVGAIANFAEQNHSKMYLQKVVIENIRSISHFEMEFPEPAGWHVLIGDNGSGKTTIVRAISLGLMGENEAKGLNAFQDWNAWLHPQKPEGKISLTISRDNDFDKPIPTRTQIQTTTSSIQIKRKNGPSSPADVFGQLSQANALWGDSALSGWFSIAYGPFRRLTGGDGRFKDLFERRPRLAAHLSAFREEVDMHHVVDWMKDRALDARRKKQDKKIIEGFKSFINKSGLLPHGAEVQDIDSEGIQIKGANEVVTSLYDMSDGYRSVMAMTMDLIRYLVKIYGADKVFSESEIVAVPGVVLIDEIDAHLHPTWQIRIGQWFTQYFPNIQFIVTTHSPLICRACDKGSIWRLAAPGSGQPSGEITGTDKDRLVFGNILDAYGTEVFGEGVVRGAKSEEKRERLGHLNMLYALGKIEPAEEKERFEIQKILTTDAPTGF